MGFVRNWVEYEHQLVQSKATKKAPRDCSLRANLKFIGWQSIDNRVNRVNRVNEVSREANECQISLILCYVAARFLL